MMLMNDSLRVFEYCWEVNRDLVGTGGVRLPSKRFCL
jgi:hypothetical protein